MAQTKANVTATKPVIGGAVWIAPAGTSVPTDATTALASTFKSLGYISTDGLTNAETRETAEIKAWGGDTVNNPQTGKADAFRARFIEFLNIELMKLIHGSGNVTGTALSTGITVKANSTELENHAFVVDMIHDGGILHRITIPDAKVTEIGEIVYRDDDVVGGEVTLTAYADTNGNTHYDYFKTPPTSGTPS